MKNFRRTVAGGVCLATVTMAGACAGEDSSPSSGSTSERTRSFSVEEAHLSFDLPSDWQAFDRDKVEEAPSDNAAMDELTDRMGMSSEQFRQMMASNIVLYVTAPHADAGFLGNVNVIVADEKLPSQGAIELQYRGLGATDIESDDASTDVGHGFSTTYTLDLNGVEVHGQAILLDVEQKSVAITISSHDAGETDALADEVLQSLTSTP